MFSIVKINEDIGFFKGGVNTGIVKSGRKAVLIDCCDMLSAPYMKKAGIDTVDMVLFTQHRRPNTAGIYSFLESETRIVVPHKEQELFKNVERYWNDPGYRWHLYNFPPSTQILPYSVPVSETVGNGSMVKWEGFAIRVLETPGATEGSLSYIIERDNAKICFCGDLIYDGGRLWDLYSLQRGENVSDYHGFLGNRKKLVASLYKILDEDVDMLVPSRGDAIYNPHETAACLIERLDKLYLNYYSISALNYYKPDYFKEFKDGSSRMEPAAMLKLPDFIIDTGFRSRLVVSGTGDGLLIDCGAVEVVRCIGNMIRKGRVKSIDKCWVTHYHDDHVDYLDRLEKEFRPEIISTKAVEEILKYPERFYLPCLSSATVNRVKGLPHGCRWKWNEFVLTALHFPGQTFYHGGLLVEGYGKKILFAGDSFSPTGIDDYCCGNRNFSGSSRGFRYCIDLIKKYKPDYIINQHQPKPFVYTDEQLVYMDKALMKRYQILEELLPWEHPDFGLDEWWVRVYPYEQEILPGSEAIVNLQFTNHGSQSAKISVQPVLPVGWKTLDSTTITIPEGTCGSNEMDSGSPDISMKICIPVPTNAENKLYIIPFRINWNGKYLGQFRHMLINVKNS